MAINRKPNPTGVDKPIDTLQVLLFNGLVDDRGWLNYESYHRAYKNDKTEFLLPEVFEKDNNYQIALMNDDFNVTSFFLVENKRPINDGGITEVTVSIIFQANLKKLFPTAPVTSRFDEELINDISSVLDKLGGLFKVTEIATTIDDVYVGFDTEEMKKRGDDMEPFNVVRFDILTKYQANCGDVYATNGAACNISTTVTTTPPTVFGGNNGTATSNEEDNNDTVTYLWTTIDGFIPAGEEIKKTATGLIAGTYSVLVTDGEPDNCNASNSGVVADGEFDPYDIAGLVNCLDMRDTSTINGGGGVVFNDPIEDMADLSSALIDGTQPLVNRRALWRTDHAFLDGVNDFHDFGTALSKRANRTSFFVLDPSFIPNGFIAGDINSSGGSKTAGVAIGMEADIRLIHGDGNNFKTTDGSSSLATGFQLIMVKYASGDILEEIEINGIGETETDGGGTATSIAGAAFRTSLGRPGEVDGAYWGGKFYHRLEYNSKLSSANVDLITAWYKGQYPLLPIS